MLSTLSFTLIMISSISTGSRASIIAFSSMIPPVVPGYTVNTLSPINPSDAIPATASFRINFLTSFLMIISTLTDVSVMSSISSTVPIRSPLPAGKWMPTWPSRRGPCWRQPRLILCGPRLISAGPSEEQGGPGRRDWEEDAVALIRRRHVRPQ